MYIENLKTRDFYVLNENEAAAYLEHIFFKKHHNRFDEDYLTHAKGDSIIDWGLRAGHIMPCSDGQFDYWHVIPHREVHAYDVERVREGGLYLADSLVNPGMVFSNEWLGAHRYEFKYRFAR